MRPQLVYWWRWALPCSWEQLFQSGWKHWSCSNGTCEQPVLEGLPLSRHRQIWAHGLGTHFSHLGREKGNPISWTQSHSEGSNWSCFEDHWAKMWRAQLWRQFCSDAIKIVIISTLLVVEIEQLFLVGNRKTFEITNHESLSLGQEAR